MKLLTEALAFLMHSVLFSYLLQWSVPIFAPALPRGAQRFRQSCKSFANNEAAQTHSCWLVCIVCVCESVCIWLNLNWFIHAVRQPCSHSESEFEVMQVTINWSVFFAFLWFMFTGRYHGCLWLYFGHFHYCLKVRVSMTYYYIYFYLYFLFIFWPKMYMYIQQRHINKKKKYSKGI